MNGNGGIGAEMGQGGDASDGEDRDAKKNRVVLKDRYVHTYVGAQSTAPTCSTVHTFWSAQKRT